MLRKEVERCENLLQSEPDRTKCKWPTLTLARLHELLQGLEGALFRFTPPLMLCECAMLIVFGMVLVLPSMCEEPCWQRTCVLCERLSGHCVAEQALRMALPAAAVEGRRWCGCTRS